MGIKLSVLKIQNSQGLWGLCLECRIEAPRPVIRIGLEGPIGISEWIPLEGNDIFPILKFPLEPTTTVRYPLGLIMDTEGSDYLYHNVIVMTETGELIRSQNLTPFRSKGWKYPVIHQDGEVQLSQDGWTIKP